MLRKSFNVVRFACFRLGMNPLKVMMKVENARTAQTNIDHQIRVAKLSAT